METTIDIKDGEVIKKTYKIRQVGRAGSTIETTVPKEVFEREARRQGMDVPEALAKLVAVWRYDGFRGLHLSFELNQKSDKIIRRNSR